MVAKEAPKASPGNSIFRLQGNRIYKGFSINQADCLATLFETKTQRGNVLEAVIYGGITIITEYKVQQDGKYVPGEVLYTIKNNKIYRGASTDAKDCLLTFTGSFTSSRLLFMAVELTK